MGRWGENVAAQFFIQRGFSILAHNVRTPHGEIDIIAQQGSLIVFVEVKTRSSTAFGHPETSITPRKQAHMLAAAQFYLQTHPELSGDWRVDVIAIQRCGGQPPEIVHFENALH